MHADSFEFKKTFKHVQMRYIGAGSGGSFFGLAFHPKDTNTILASGDMGATYITKNKGKTWDIVAADSNHYPRDIFTIKYHPKNPSLVWASGSDLYFSKNEGLDWNLSTLPHGTYGAIGLDPDNENIVYVAEGQTPRFTLDWTHGRVFKSTNQGKTWHKIQLPYDTNLTIKHPNFTKIIIDPNSHINQNHEHQTLYIVGRGGLFRSFDAGKTWKQLATQFAKGQLADMILLDNTLILSVTPAKGLMHEGIYISHDKGNTWLASNQGLSDMLYRLKTRNTKLKDNPDASIAPIYLASSKKHIYTASWQGIYRSDDMGKTWQMCTPPEGAKVVRGISIPHNKKHFKNTLWGGINEMNAFCVHPKNPKQLLFADNQDIYISNDHAKTWQSLTFHFGKNIYSKKTQQYHNISYLDHGISNRYTHEIINHGIQNTVCTDIAIDPFDSNTIACAYMDLGLEITHNGGISWEHPTSGMQARGHAWSVLYDKHKRGTLYLTVSQTGVQKGGVFQSTNGGKSWKRITPKIYNRKKDGKLHTLQQDEKHQLLYVGTSKNGLYCFNTHKQIWKHINILSDNNTSNQNSTANQITTLAVDKQGNIYAGTPDGLYLSEDKGTHWTKLAQKQNFGKIKTISICQDTPSVLYINAHRKNNNGYWGQRDLWHSSDGGKHFTNITPAYFKYAGAIGVNPYNCNYIYAVNGLYEASDKRQKLHIVRSKDAGKHWEIIEKAINSNRGKKIYINPNHPKQIFVLTAFGIIEIIDKDAPIR